MNGSKKQAQNRALILDLIYSRSPISRIDIAKMTGITPATTSALTNELIKEGLVKEIGEEDSVKAGRKKIFLEVAEKVTFFLGIELSEKYFTFILADNLGNIQEQDKYSLTIEEIKTCGFDKFKTQFQKLLTKYQNLPLQAVGIAVPGHYNYEKNIVTNNPLWQTFDLDAIHQLCSLPIFFANNVECMAIKKRIFDKDKKNDNFVYFHIGRGIKCSYMYENTLFSKHNFLLGELGHIVVDKDGSLCECGKKGCLQTFISENWLIKRAQLLFNTNQESYLKHLVKNPEAITIHTLLTAFELGDKNIQILFDQALQALSQVILNLNLVLDIQSLYLHSELFSNPNLQQLLLNKLSIEPNLLTLPKTPTIYFENYTPYDGAVAAVALAVKQYYLDYSKYSL
ncbi:MAG TPA: ROK family transcriptional regulator [Enterococcus columbae]|nr:ROK family transcriptional regulator [Enterococcus columbae]